MVPIAGDTLTRLKRAQSKFIHLAIIAVWFSLALPPAHATSKHAGRAARVQTGLDVLEALKFAPLRGKHVGIITNHTGLDSQEHTTVDVLSRAAGVQLVALFSPEHGLAGRNDERIASSKDPSTGLPVYSLYGETLRPTDEMLKGIDALVFDVQDAGVRFYTYTATMAYCMEEAAKRHIAFFCPGPPQSARRANCGRPDARRRQNQFRRIFSIAGALRAHHWRASAIFQRRKSHRRRPPHHRHEELASQLFL